MKSINIIFLSFIFLFNIISTQDDNICSSITPEIRYDCFKYSTSQQFCCFEKMGSPCQLIDKTNITNNTDLDCGVTEENYGLYEFEEYHPRPELGLPFQGCGEKNPDKKEDCLAYSDISNSCCFFKNSGKKGCYYIGRRYTGNLDEKSFIYKGNKYTYECKSYYVFVNFSFVLFLLILFF